MTKYVQFDEMETFEHNKERPLGIELSIRPKTGQILSSKVCRIPIKALTLSPMKKNEYNSKTNRVIVFKEMMLETSKALNENYSVLPCDGTPQIIHLAIKLCVPIL